ncbi:MAG TPA: hypothetical protein DD490_28980, partial [Acidobacteria bacterium]|nr:hypothetical protein [Acidobacteriota bacterium]
APPAASAPPQAVPAGQRPTIAVLGFRDLAGNPETAWLGVAFAEMLTTELAAGGQARLITGDNVTRVRQSLAIPYTEAPRGPDLVRLRSILGADLVVVGTYLALEGEGGSRQVRLDLQVMKLPEGTVVAMVPDVGKESGLFEMVARVGARLRQDLGLGGLSQEQTRAVQSLHPAVPEAARLMAQGLARLRAFDPMEARVLLEKAVAVEPESAVIHSLLARAWNDLGEDARALGEAQRALELSRGLPREERLVIEARFFAAGKQWAKAAEIYRSLWTFFPDDLDHGLQLAVMLVNSGRSHEALEVLAMLRQWPTGRDDPRIDLEEARAARRVADLPTQQRAVQNAAAKARKSGERLALARALILEGDALVTIGRPAEAVPRFREAEELARAVGHSWYAGMALSNLGGALQTLGRLEEAEQRNQQALAIARRLGSANGTANQLFSLGLVHKDRGDLDEALALFEEARAGMRAIDDRLMQGRVASHMVPVLLQKGDLAAAQELADDAVKAAREVGNRADEAQALAALAQVRASRGDLARARQDLETALHLLLGLRVPALAASTLSSSADVLSRLGVTELARRRLEQAIATEKRAGDKLVITGQVLSRRAQVALRGGDVAQARTLLEELLLLARRSGARVYEASGFYDLGRVQLAAGDRAGARASLQKSLKIGEATGDGLLAAQVRIELARLALVEKKNAEAGALARDAAAWLVPRGFTGLDAEALALAAEASLRAGRPEEAEEPLEKVRGVVASLQDRELGLRLAASLARAAAAAGDRDGAARALQVVISDAQAKGFLLVVGDARRLLAEVNALARPAEARSAERGAREKSPG